jgi:alkylhydroperoxidase/carboxymuconolactone decarboxylase family protein YurZ
MLPRITSMTLNRRRAVLGFLVAAPFQSPSHAKCALLNQTKAPDMTEHASPLTDKQLSIGSIAASTATGASPRLATALHRGLDAGLVVSEIKEILVQLYAYAGFPRALNALGEFMKVLDERRDRGIKDVAGVAPGPVPTGELLLEVGTANQTRLSGAPVRGPLFEFAPAIDQFLKTHLFGDIFARDNLDWQSRELATVAALAAMQGVEPQLLAHVRISMNTGLAADQLRQFAAELAMRGDSEAGQRAQAALEKHLAGTSRR